MMSYPIGHDTPVIATFTRTGYVSDMISGMTRSRARAAGFLVRLNPQDDTEPTRFLVRLSRDERIEFKRLAAVAGTSMQSYARAKLFGDGGRDTSHAELKRLADEAGFTMQSYAQARLFDKPFQPTLFGGAAAMPRRRRTGPSQTEELPLTG